MRRQPWPPRARTPHGPRRTGPRYRRVRALAV